ncbi:DUF423 domain-containing protein [Gillisia sp. M10.2A]|uniref:DUF423 domain-containing protein n=1 Tax=Gillisia lutea TaxID=2909668 RepID=A0ABS9EBM4_9FLAO|nr:DUF423 domain-containing protein [Gillisia lutea]MCF4100285.1 DUF423 domain-containing protein [Gillisia lutea]
MSRRFYISGFLFGLIAIILGAFATHGLKPLLSVEAMVSFETGVKYQIYHSLLLIVLGNIKELALNSLKWVYYFLMGGIILFSGSIYLLATNALTGFDFTKIALLTPLGGSLLILAWALLLFKFITLKNK